jgi:hypothetical protein
MAEHDPSRQSGSSLSRAGALLSRVLIVLLLGLCALPACAQVRPSQFDVESAYLLNFGKFMHLTQQSNALRRATFDICILGRDPLEQTIDELAANDTINGRSVRVVRVNDAFDARTCAITFISSHEDGEIRDALNVLNGADVLTVSDAPNFIQDGGMVQFVLQKDHVRFAVNLKAVEKTHLVLSSELLRVALYVTGEPQTGGAP